MNDLTLVIGAGITGLSAAHALQRAGKRVAVLEASERVGGRLVRLRHGDDAAEAGGQGIHSNYTEMLRLVSAYGLGDDLMPQLNNKVGYLDRSGRLCKGGKLTMLRLMGLRGTWDLSKFFAKHLTGGPRISLFESDRNIEAYDRMTADQGLPGASAGFRDFFLRPASDAMLNTTPTHSSLYHALNLMQLVTTTTVSTLRTGNVTLAERMAQQVPVQLGSRVKQVLTDRGRARGVLLDGGKVIDASHVIVASPMDATARMLPNDWPGALEFTSSFESAPFVLVYFFLDRPLPSDVYVCMGHGYRDTSFNMAIHHTEKTPHLVPSGKAIISAWSSYPNSAQLIGQSDDVVVRKAQQDLDAFFPNFGAWIERAHVQRHPWGIGRIGPGQYQKILDFKRESESYAGISFASNDMDGVHMESGVRAGLRAARRAQSQLE